ncbi:MAG: TlpA family protein disulfide reductase [Phyllobacteriaceae bacterium]|nr:TlpA family protein disulfide reductase [Phyllobacteriaceae bacterium]
MITRRLLLAAPLTLLPSLARAGDLVGETPTPIDFSVRDRDGRPIGPRDLAARLTLVHFWASWCGSCRVEFPALDAFQRDMGREGVKVAAVSLDRLGWDAIDRTVEKLAIRDLALFHDPNRDAARALGIVGLPTTVVMDADAREIGRITGQGAWDDAAFRDRLRELMPKAS